MGQNFFDFGHFWYFEESQIKNQVFVRRGGVGKRGAAVKGLNGKVIDFNANFSQKYLFIYFEMFSVVKAKPRAAASPPRRALHQRPI